MNLRIVPEIRTEIIMAKEVNMLGNVARMLFICNLLKNYIIILYPKLALLYDNIYNNLSVYLAIKREFDVILDKYMDLVRNKVVNKALKYFIVTYGCQMNTNDSEKLSGMLKKMGYEEANSESEADMILYNTCCVREHAEQKVYGNVGALKTLKQQNPNMIIGVCGCMMQQPEMAETMAKKFPFVDIVFGTHNLHHFPKLLYDAMDANATIVEILPESKDIVEDIPIARDKSVSAWVTIMYGCNNFCTYCIVPYVRGREKSRKPQDIIDEIKDLAANGYKEITLLGQNVNSYGKDLGIDYMFANLLRDIDKIDGIQRVRFMTSHPKDLSLDLIEAIGECDKVCEHLHLPIQSGSDHILSSMNRRYTKEDYLTLVDRLRRKVPNISLTTDIIVGFPGETEQDFLDTLDIVEKVQFDSAFTFMYSPRTGTPAAKKEDQIPQEVKKERLARLMKLQNEITRQKNEEYGDKIVEVLVEGISKNNDRFLSGRTRTNRMVHFEGGTEMIGKLVRVKITRTKSFSLEGVIV
ncbi:MAG: tRNA (N6-isopentenyl adenosine(37)-C2)-methylthiotransferase MiaB [Xylanivirga thermophila]|jgi:tRNA-2-methylthio-N6-dimethylallyladenosine synthase